mgnify:CR=1 FL=1
MSIGEISFEQAVTTDDIIHAIMQDRWLAAIG